MVLRAIAERQARLPRPRLAEGVELLGEYQGSGLHESPYLVRRASGQVLQLTRLLYLVAAKADGVRDAAAIAAEVSEELGRRVTTENVVQLVEHRLVPAGLVVADGAPPAPSLAASAPFALRLRAALVPAGAVRVAAALLRPLFAPVVVGAVLAWLAAFDGWLALEHGFDAALRELLARPALLLLVYLLVVAGTVVHELGHAAACRYGGGRPGRLGVGLYFVWPVFYTDVTDAYRLDRTGRLRTDLGGVYFNAVFVLVLAAVYVWTGFEPLLVVVLVQHVQALQQLLPWLRLDGYYVLTDLVGVPDVLSRIRPILASLVPGRKPEPRVAELKHWVRAVVTGYIVVTVPLVVAAYAALFVNAPRVFSQVRRSLGVQLELLEQAWRADDVAGAALAAVQALALIIPAVGVAVVLAASLARLARVALARVGRVRGLRTATAFAAGIAAASLFFAGFTSGGVVEQLGRAETKPLAKVPKPHRVDAPVRRARRPAAPGTPNSRARRPTNATNAEPPSSRPARGGATTHDTSPPPVDTATEPAATTTSTTSTTSTASTATTATTATTPTAEAPPTTTEEELAP